MSKHFISSTLNNNLIHCTDETDLNTALTVGNVGKVYELNNTVYEVDTGGSSFVNKPYKDDVGSGAYRFKRYAGLSYLCFTAEADTDIAFNINGTLTTTPTVQYSLDRKTWNNYTFGNAISLTTGQSCYWKGDNNSWSTGYSQYIKFTSTGNVKASGNIMTLLDSTGESTTIPCNGCFYQMFYQCTTLITPPELPATVLTDSCYFFMFNGCTSLIKAPALPATTLASWCYYATLANCTQLQEVPALPATTLANGCYNYMFEGCTSLYVSDTSGTGYDKAWRIPTSGTFTNTYSQSGMFTSCLGTRSSDNMAGASGQSYTYYTQNTPV